MPHLAPLFQRRLIRVLPWLLHASVAAAQIAAPEPPAASAPQYDLTQDKVLYCIGYAHLDTQWRWDFPTTIDKYLKATLDENFERFERYPGYVFNFTGSVRYEMFKEYYPQRYARLKQYIADGRWFVSGSSVDEGDVNVPAAEATIRQVLYGNQFFRREFGQESQDYMLPDCFGFPASMPSIWAHCGLEGFSTQKLTWGSAVGIPFGVGVWEGPDGRGVVAALDPGAYVGAIEGRVDTNEKWVRRVRENGERYGVWADYHYYGVGDQGGAPRAKDIENYLASIGNEDGKITVALTSSDQMYKDLTPEMKSRLPRYKGDLLLTEHSAGTLTSQAYMKRWNRKNEILADAAERAAVAADYLGGAAYPLEKLRKCWVRVLANQMHDILPGTSIPRAYRYSWNDEIVAANGFAEVLTDSIGAVTRALDTRVEGQAVVVYNPLAIERTDVVDATIRFPEGVPAAVRIFGPDGAEVPSQELGRSGNSVHMLFLASTPPVSFGVYDARAAKSPFSENTGLVAKERRLENGYYRVTLDYAGNVNSIIDKANGNRELLAGPHELIYTYEKPAYWPAWNMDWKDRQLPPVNKVMAPAAIHVVENGPVRVAIEVQRSERHSIFTQRIRLAAGDAGKRLEFATTVDWQDTECALKASFSLTARNPDATYNWGMGTIARGNNEPTKYEVPSHEWFDLTDQSGEFGVSILEDCKYGSDKPGDSQVRLTLLYTPGVRNAYMDQHSQDWGRHEMLYALYGHAGDWRDGRSEWQGRRLNQPLIPFQVSARHAGPLGRDYSLARLNTQQVDIRALKRAEAGDWLIVRLQELWGRKAEDVVVQFAGPVVEACEVDGQERRIGDARIERGALRVSMGPYRPRSFAVRLAKPADAWSQPRSEPVELAYDTDVLSNDANRADGSFGPHGRTIPAEMLPREVVTEGVRFQLAPNRANDVPNAVACTGQAIALPDGEYTHVFLLAAADEDTTATFYVDDQPHERTVQRWTGFVGQWDDRVWDRKFKEVDHHCDGRVIDITTGYIKRDPIAWFCTHHHHPTEGNRAYEFSYLFKYALPLPDGGAKTLRLPRNPHVKVFAVSAVNDPNVAARPARPLYDDFSDREPIVFRYQYPEPPEPVFSGATAVGEVLVDRAETFADLEIGPPVATDYVDASQEHGVVFKAYTKGGEYRPHAGSGAIDHALPRLNDGAVAQNSDDTERCVWYDSEGRFYLDLHRRLPIEKINVYSWHRSNRAPQYFSVWGSRESIPPPLDFTHENRAGWELLGVVDTRELGDGGKHGSSVRAADGVLGPYRHLLWVAENMGQGTFFTEVDVHVAD